MSERYKPKTLEIRKLPLSSATAAFLLSEGCQSGLLCCESCEEEFFAILQRDETGIFPKLYLVECPFCGALGAQVLPEPNRIEDALWKDSARLERYAKHEDKFLAEDKAFHAAGAFFFAKLVTALGFSAWQIVTIITVGGLLVELYQKRRQITFFSWKDVVANSVGLAASFFV